MLAQEETTEYEQDRRHVYKLNWPPNPAKDYRGELVVTPNPTGGTDLHWSGSFTETLPGTGPIVRAAIHGALRFFARRLVKAAERESR